MDLAQKLTKKHESNHQKKTYLNELHQEPNDFFSKQTLLKIT